ncbi:MAG: serine/threonine protein kinase [Kiritimatiellae bacterium]|nr:serine/threonine protein kinase [Kiritimatiellia bacterium]
MIPDSNLADGSGFGEFTVVKLLGRGGMCSVHLVEKDGARYALKVLSPRVARENPEYVKRFVREAKIAMSVRHPNLVAVHDAGFSEEHGVYYILMDYVGGCDLRTAIAMGGAMEPNEAVRIISSVAGALAAGEGIGIVHRDIKPENIMIDEGGIVKLVDLGVAKARGTDSLQTMPRTVFGTPNYISPEQAQDASKVDSRADVYSLGVVLFELLTGKRPYECEKPKEVLAKLLSPEELPDVRSFNPGVPERLAAIVKMMLAKNPRDRIASASRLLEWFEKIGYDTSGTPNERSASASRQSDDGFSYAAYSETVANNTLSFETQDEEIRSFVSSLKTKRRTGRILRLAAAVLGVILVVVAVLKFAILD